MAEQVPYGVIVSVINKLGSLAFREIALIYGVKSEVEKLKDTVEAIKAVLLDAERKQHHDNLVRLWIRRLKQVLLSADDLLDDIQTEDLLRKRDDEEKARGKVRELFSSSKKIPFRLKIAHKMKKIRDLFNAISEDMSKLNFDRRVVVMGHHESNRRETSSFVHKEDIIGREESKEEIIDLLLNTDNNQDISPVAIVGIGGLGKTALAQLVYNDVEVKNYFQKQIWVCVSEDFDVKALVQKILESLIRKKVDDLQLELLQNKLQENLNGQKYLLVLDDVWNDSNHEKWLQLRNYLMCGAQGSKILVTTRNQMVARNLGVKTSYVLKGLTNDQSWALLKKLAFGEDKIMTRSLESIGRKIAEKCGGVPLAIRTMGSMLRTKTEEREWKTILEGDFWKSCKDSDSIIPILKLSYDNLSIELRHCFAYCSLYPKDDRYSKDKLIQLWMAQGYLECSNEKQCMEDIGERYFDILLMRSFFQDAEMDEFDEVKYVKMHDLMHDLAQIVAGSEFCYLHGEEKKGDARPMHVYVEMNPNCSLDSLDASTLRTILAAGRLSDDPFSTLKFNCLRVLSLSRCSMLELPKSMGELKHLRYLDLSYCRSLTNLPKSMSNLINLQTLKLRDCAKLQFSITVTKLTSLRYLEILHCKAFNEGMPIGLKKLTALQYLSDFTVGNDSNEEKKYAKVNELKELNLRSKFSIRNLRLVRDVEGESKEVNLKEKKYLKSLKLNWRNEESVWRDDLDVTNSDSLQLLENLEPHPNLKQLIVKCYPGVRFSRWLSSLTNLVELSITHCPNVQYLPALDGFYSLKTLWIEKMDALEYIFYKGREEEEEDCSTSTTDFFPSLKTLNIRWCKNFRGWLRAARVSNKYKVDAERRVSLPPFPRLSYLRIYECPNLICMPTFPNLMGGLELSKSSIKPLIDTVKVGTWTDLVPSLSMLQSLKFQDMGIEALPERWMRNLTSLKHLSIGKLSSIVPLFCQMRHLLATLEEFQFQVDNDDLDAFRGDDFWTLRKALDRLHSLQTICFFFCYNLKALPEWICHIQSLRYIKIVHCVKLESLPERMHRLTNLQSLELDYAPLLKERCEKEAGADWPKIAHIPNIIIDRRQI